LITVAALKKDNEIRLALSGLCPFPFRSKSIEKALNNRDIPASERVSRALEELPGPILDDVEGSADYRRFVLRNLLLDVVEVLDGAAA
jgi:aerobic carbon-monoxide dehydrogenase medium subunit